MKQLQEIITEILEYGDIKGDRTGTGTMSVFGIMKKWDLRKGFPLVTLKQMFPKSIIGELIWFCQGKTNVEELRTITYGENSKRKTIWDDNYNKQAVDLGYWGGELGPIYGHQWRYGNGVDQLKNAIELIRNEPNSRRIIVNAWNVNDLDKMALVPCHVMYQFNVSGEYLDLMWTQRSCDCFLGIPYNIASYGVLLTMVAKMTGKTPRFLVFSGADVHIYNNHIEQCEELLKRTPKNSPKLVIKKDLKNISDFDTLTVDDFEFIDYTHHEKLTGEMAV